MSELIEAKIVPVAKAEPSRADMFLIIATWMAAPQWVVPGKFRDSGTMFFTSLEDAKEAAAKMTIGWRNVRIVRIPGNELESG